MKVLITHKFNEKMKKLSKSLQQEVAKLFSFANKAEKEEIVNSPLLTKIISEDNSIFILRGNNIRIFCTFNYEGNEKELLFLDVASVKDILYKKTSRRRGETTLFGRNGEPIAYIAHQEGNTIYTFAGKPCAYIDDSNNIYGFNGKHLGWFEDDFVRDHQGYRIGFTESTCPVFTQFEPFKGFKEFKPFKGFKQFRPLKPIKSYVISETSLLAFLKEGR